MPQWTPTALSSRAFPFFWELLFHHCPEVPIQDLPKAPPSWLHLLVPGIASEYLFIGWFVYRSFCIGTEGVNQFLFSVTINKKHCSGVVLDLFPTKAHTKMSICLRSCFLVRPREPLPRAKIL